MALMQINGPMKERWLDQVWLCLFGDSGGGLVSPGQIRREGLDRARVRRAELAAIVSAERELEDLRSGRKMLDQRGRMIDAVAVGDVPMHSVIERPPADEDAIFSRLAKPQNLLNAVASEMEHRDLQRSLVIRRLALLAEQEVLAGAVPRTLAARAPGSQWLQRWRQLAQDSDHPELQRLWARLLAREVAVPGRHSLAALDTLSKIGESDIAGLRLLAGFSFGEFMFDARTRYFQPELHGVWLETAAALGLLQPLGITRGVTLHRRDDSAEPLLLVCHNRALQLSGLGPAGVRVPVLRISAVGRQLFGLCGGAADMAYLLDFAAYLSRVGVRVALGNWDQLHRRFDKQLDYAG